MSYGYSPGLVVADAQADVRAAFIRRTYGHLAGAILAFIGIEYLLLHTSLKEIILPMFTGWGVLIMFVLFVVVSHLATMWAQSGSSPEMQYLGLGLYVLIEALIFLPILFVADSLAEQNPAKYGGVVGSAAILTLAVFGGLTAAVIFTRKDYSFLGPIISVCSLVALGVVVAGMLFGFNLGLFFSFAMVALASACILYQTSNILYHYRADQHVAAALALFAAVALLFYYILRIALASRSGD